MDRLLWQRFARQLPSLGNVSASFFAPWEDAGSPDATALPMAGFDERPSGVRTAVDDVVRDLASYESYAVLVAMGDRIVGSWYAHGFNADSLLQSQSMHKTVQAILVGIAIDQGVIDSVDDPIGRYLVEWVDDERGAITVRHLLAMRSGLATFPISPLPTSRFWRLMFAADSRPVLLSAEAVEPPGGAFAYNDVNAALLGLVLEAAFRAPYAQVLHDHLLAPIGAPEARVWLSDTAHRRPHTECCLLTPAQTWLRIGMLLRDGGRWGQQQVVPSAWIAEMTTPSGDYPSYGYLTWLDAPAFAGPPWKAAVRAEVPVPGGDLVYLQGYGGQLTMISRSLDTVIVRMGPSGGREPMPRATRFDHSAAMRRIERALQDVPSV